MSMKSINTAAITVMTLGLSVGLRAQDEPVAKDVKQEPKAGAEFCSTSQVIGAKVRMVPSAEAQREAAAEGEQAKRPEGKVDDIIVDCHTGAVEYAVVSLGGFIGIGDKTVAVPVEAMRWNGAHERFDVDATEERLKALPAFNLSQAKKSGLDGTAVIIRSDWQGKKMAEVKDATAETEKTKPVALEGTTYFVVPTRLIAASEIDDFPVYAAATKFGKVNDLLIDRGRNAIALAVVSRGGALGVGSKSYLIPYRALKLCTSGEERVLCVNCDTAKLETAVVFEKPKNGAVDPEAARRALTMFKEECDVPGNGK